MSGQPTSDILTVSVPPGIELSTTEGGLMARAPRGLLEALAREIVATGEDGFGPPREPQPAPRTPTPGGPSGLAVGAVHDDDSPAWELLSAHHRYQQPRFAPDEPAVASDAWRTFSPRARLLLGGTSARPGVLLSTEEAAEAAGVEGPFAVAGVLNGFVGGCEATGRAFPVWAFERPGAMALYGTPPSVAAAFAAPVAAGGPDRRTIRARRDPRWRTEVVPATVELLADVARRGRTVRYLELADAVHAAVPDARPRHRGKGGVNWLLADLLSAVHEIDPALPLLTSVVVAADGRPGGGFGVQWRALKGTDRPVDAAAEREACASAYTPEVVSRLVRDLRAGG